MYLRNLVNKLTSFDIETAGHNNFEAQYFNSHFKQPFVQTHFIVPQLIRVSMHEREIDLLVLCAAKVPGTPGDEGNVGADMLVLVPPPVLPPIVPAGHTGMHTGTAGGDGGVRETK